jgi:nitrate/nitrite-specific signal transduction histidine kinase
MIRGIFVSEDGQVQLIGNDVNLEKIVEIMPQLEQQLKEAYKAQIKEKINNLRKMVEEDTNGE